MKPLSSDQLREKLMAIMDRKDHWAWKHFSGPLITTLVDASGLFLYLSIAKLMIAKLHGG